MIFLDACLKVGGWPIMWMENATTLYSVAYNDYFFFVKVGLQGVYFITLTTPSYTAMQKLLVKRP